jgi:hypothetical protein
MFVGSCRLSLAIVGGSRPFFIVADYPYEPNTKKYFKRNHFSLVKIFSYKKHFMSKQNRAQISMPHENNKESNKL